MPPPDQPVPLSDEPCVGCERYRAGIEQITEQYEAEINRLQAALREAWADG